ncbi:Ctr copper transporter [Xylariaceae sp. FL0255]|nr:Ctr copper transporter [Xylariaceae sp. FL0255]
MLWNWNTVDACFLSESWMIKSQGAFAALCIGVILIVILLEGLRRVSKMYDQYLVQRHSQVTNLAIQTTTLAITDPKVSATTSAAGSLINKEEKLVVQSSFRPTVAEQAVRALLHTLQFATAYWIMLLAMYYNGYIIISIFIGAYIGAFIFQWERIGIR